jgi:hypothetical protein
MTVTGSLASLSVSEPTGTVVLLADWDMRFHESVEGTYTMGCHVTHHIRPGDGGRDGLWNVGLYLHLYIAGSMRRFHCIQLPWKLQILCFKLLKISLQLTNLNMHTKRLHILVSPLLKQCAWMEYLSLLQDIDGDSWDANAWVPLYHTQSHCQGSDTLMYSIL